MPEVKVTVSHDHHPVMKHVLQQLASLKNADKPEGLTLQGAVISNVNLRTASQIKAKTRAMINGKVEGIACDDHINMVKKSKSMFLRLLVAVPRLADHLLDKLLSRLQVFLTQGQS